MACKEASYNSMSTLKDQEHIERLRQGDLNAYTYFVDSYKSMVYAICLKIIKDPSEAEDVAQEAFIKAYEKINSFKSGSKFSTWLYTITYRAALYHKRKNKIDARAIVHQDNAVFESTETTQIENSMLREQQFYIKKAIDDLPTMEGLIITLYYLDENSIEEIAAITGLSYANIKVKLFRARKKLKKILHHLLNGETKSLL